MEGPRALAIVGDGRATEVRLHALLNYHETSDCNKPCRPLFAGPMHAGLTQNQRSNFSQRLRGVDSQVLGLYVSSGSDAWKDSTWRTPRGFGSTTERGSAGDTGRGPNRRLQSVDDQHAVPSYSGTANFGYRCIPR